MGFTRRSRLRLRTVALSPDLVFLMFPPPILWAAAYFISWQDFWKNLRPIARLARGVVYL
jgi:NhaP-type Na+/H+ or K+/H+ antiporter